MRIIKFRLWDKEKKRMLFTIGGWDVNAEYSELSFSFIVDVEQGDKDEYEIMQYTGLKDRNGKDIYEGDVVQAYLDLPASKGKWKDPFEVRFEGYGYNLSGRDVWEGDMGETDVLTRISYKVIGNIYENPNLIKGKK